MNQVAEKIRYSEAYLEDALVLGRAQGGFSVRAGGRRLDAKRAVGCLVEPEAGDRVLLAWVGDERFVLNVLERDAGVTSRLSVDGNLEVQVPAGRFSVVSKDGIALSTPQATTITSGAVDVAAQRVSLTSEALSFLGAVLTADVAKLKVVGGQAESVFERVLQRVKRSYRFVEEMDQLRAHHLDYRAKATAHIHSENTLLTAEDVVKLDAKQVHLG